MESCTIPDSPHVIASRYVDTGEPLEAERISIWPVNPHRGYSVRSKLLNPLVGQRRQSEPDRAEELPARLVRLLRFEPESNG